MKLKVILFLLIVLTIVSACGRKGQDGKEGVVGVKGSTGPQGAPGVDTASISMVKLCPGQSVYPSVFVEYAFCVNGALYATYSANGGFSTLLPPGNYSSNAIGSSCSFTVSSGCEVNN